MFRNEDEFQAFFIRHLEHLGKTRTFLGNWIFAKISQIAGKFIQPEIDLLGFSPTSSTSPNLLIRAFEFKILNSRRIGNNYNRLYAGIGQALSYFKYGIDQSYLVVGIPANIQGRNVLEKMITAFGGVVRQLHIDSFGVITYDEFTDAVTYPPQLSIGKGKFVRKDAPAGDFRDQVELARENLCASNFSKERGRNFFKKFGLDRYMEP